jgi:hypothetical protein
MFGTVRRRLSQFRVANDRRKDVGRRKCLSRLQRGQDDGRQEQDARHSYSRGG